jgi:hypothetical protein
MKMVAQAKMASLDHVGVGVVAGGREVTVVEFELARLMLATIRASHMKRWDASENKYQVGWRRRRTIRGHRSCLSITRTKSLCR